MQSHVQLFFGDEAGRLGVQTQELVLHDKQRGVKELEHVCGVCEQCVCKLQLCVGQVHDVNHDGVVRLHVGVCQDGLDVLKSRGWKGMVVVDRYLLVVLQQKALAGCLHGAGRWFGGALVHHLAIHKQCRVGCSSQARDTVCCGLVRNNTNARVSSCVAQCCRH